MRAKVGRLVAVVVAAVGVLLVAAPATANVPSGSRDQFQMAGRGFQEWDQGKDLIKVLRVKPEKTFRAGWCLDSWFDWTTPERPGPESGRHHMDGRVVRTCNRGFGYGKGFNDTRSGRDLRGMQKAGTCYGPKDKTTAREGNCNNAQGHSITITNGKMKSALPNSCTRSWRVDAAARTPIFHDGGVPSECRR